jgi:hypothetical protein
VPPVTPTVAYLKQQTKLLVRKDAASRSAGDFLGALNLAKDKIWALIVANDMDEKWFVEQSQFGDSGAANYFTAMLAGFDTFDMPRDFHQLKAINVTTSGKEDYTFTRGSVGDDAWKLRREDMIAGTVFRDVLYDIVGPSPGSLVVPYALPELLEAVIFYSASSLDWTDDADEVTDFPPAMLSLITHTAASILQYGMTDDRYQKYENGLEARVRTALKTIRRDETQPEYAEGVFEGSGC